MVFMTSFGLSSRKFYLNLCSLAIQALPVEASSISKFLQRGCPNGQATGNTLTPATLLIPVFTEKEGLPNPTPLPSLFIGLY